MSGEAPLRLPERVVDAHKGDFGRVLLIGGSRGMAGSIAMSSIASLRCGSGLVTAAVPDRCLETVASFHPGVMTLPMADDGQGRFDPACVPELRHLWDSVQAIGCGPGMTRQPGSVRIVENLIGYSKAPRVLDADALNVLAGLLADKTEVAGPVVLTPHPGELQQLTGVSSRDRSSQIEASREMCGRHGMVMVVKGGPTCVVDSSTVWTNTTGNPGMATAGSGDVLTGVIASMLGVGLPPWDAARLAVWVHGRAGDLAAERHGQAGMTAVEILESLPQAVQEVCGN